MCGRRRLRARRFSLLTSDRVRYVPRVQDAGPFAGRRWAMTGLTRVAAGTAIFLLARSVGAQPTDLQTYTLFGQTKTAISSAVLVQNGNVGSNGMVVIKEAADLLAGSTVAGDRIVVRQGRFQGDGYYNELIGQGTPVFGT